MEGKINVYPALQKHHLSLNRAPRNQLDTVDVVRVETNEGKPLNLTILDATQPYPPW